MRNLSLQELKIAVEWAAQRREGLLSFTSSDGEQSDEWHSASCEYEAVKKVFDCQVKKVIDEIVFDLKAKEYESI